MPRRVKFTSHALVKFAMLKTRGSTLTEEYEAEDEDGCLVVTFYPAKRESYEG